MLSAYPGQCFDPVDHARRADRAGSCADCLCLGVRFFRAAAGDRLRDLRSRLGVSLRKGLRPPDYHQRLFLLDGESALIFIDEGEIYYHPEWQRAYIKTLLDLVNSKPRVVQIIVTTNSPFIISDILNEDIIYLSADKNEEQSRKRRAEYTLGQNIHTLLKDNFYMKYTIGEYARELIETIMLCLSSKNDIKANIKLRRYFDEIDDYYNAFYLLIEEIGEPVYKHNLRKLLEESSFAKKKNKDAEEQISQLEEEKRKIQEKINILKEKNQID